ncbi:MAG: alanine racemase [Verrucomicrobiae bacterium]|nr:alanine racemase [Verrucomicrobiae bacterium]
MQPQAHYRCWVEVDLDALRQNVAALRQRIGPRVKLMAVVKDNAYGHGLPQVVHVLMQCGVDAFAVANLAEALAIRQLGGTGWPILLFGSALPFEHDMIVQHNIIATISSWEEAERLNATAMAHHKVHPVHIEIDTGMGRVGVWHETAADTVAAIRALPHLRVEGIYTHFPSADENPDETRRELALFLRVAGDGLVRHAANSAALLSLPETHLDMVRPGLALYGIGEGLTPILSFKARVAFVKDVGPGRTISYGQTYVATRPMRIATVTVGYGDGYSRHLSNRAEVLVHGRRCAVVGRVTMDHVMVDVTGIPHVACGDEVVLIGQQGEDQITTAEVARWADTIPWEVLCGINQTLRVPRVYRGLYAA